MRFELAFVILVLHSKVTLHLIKQNTVNYNTCRNNGKALQGTKLVPDRSNYLNTLWVRILRGMAIELDIC